MNVQRTLLTKLVQAKDVDRLLDLDPNKFTGENFRVLTFLKDFIADNAGHLPTKSIIMRHFKTFAQDLKKPVKEPTRYLIDELDNAYTHNSLVDVVQELTQSLKNRGKEDVAAPRDLVRQLESKLLDLRANIEGERQKPQDITQQSMGIRKRLEDRRKLGGIVGYHLPFPSLTRYLRGLRKKRLYTLIARTSVGKTVATFLIALHIWKTYNVPIVFLSGELDYEQMEDMYLSFISGISIDKIENGELSDKEMDKLQKLVDSVADKQAPFVFGFAQGFADVASEVNRTNPELLFVDSFYELDRFAEPDDTKRTAITSSRLQRLSREKDIPVFINSQANRATDKKRGADLSNISFSDTIGQTSDAVITMNQDDEMKMAREMEIVLLKNRGGRLCKVLANWNFEENDFSEIRQIDEYGDTAEDTSELTNDKVEDDANKRQSFNKLLGREKKKIVKKKDKKTETPPKKVVKIKIKGSKAA